jgi:hypothetical protein
LIDAGTTAVAAGVERGNPNGSRAGDEVDGTLLNTVVGTLEDDDAVGKPNGSLLLREEVRWDKIVSDALHNETAHCK